MHFLPQASPLTPISSRFFPSNTLWVKRDDLLHPTVSGNKFRKLKYPLQAIKKPTTTLVTMGGAWSNHLHAVAHAGHSYGFPLIGFVRGLHDPTLGLTATLRDCQQLGMQLRFVSREVYRSLREEPSVWQRQFIAIPEPYFWLPEGGSAPEALHGVAEMVEEIVNELGAVPETIIVACGTGATLAGIVAGMRGRGRVIGIAVVQNAHYLHSQVIDLLRQAGYQAYQNFEIKHEFTEGGYAKISPTLQEFCHAFSAETHIPIEPIYTGKMFYALHQLFTRHYFSEREKVVAIHTGGMQGARSQLIAQR